MRILFVSETFWPKAAGGEVWAWELCTALAARGHAVTVLTSRDGASPPDQQQDGVRIIRAGFAASSRPARAVRNMLVVRHARRLIARERFDIVHTSAYALNVPISRIAKRRGVPCITVVHSYFGDDWRRIAPLWRLLRTLERRTLRKDASAVVHVPSAYLDARIRRDMGKGTLCTCLKDRLRIIPNWCPATFPKPWRFKTPTLLFVGSLEPIKDPLACIAVAQRLRMPLVVIGQGSLERQLLAQALAARIVLTHVPHASREQTLAMIGGAAMVLVPSITESFSLVALEAVAQGTPVAGTPVGILPELPGVVRFPPSRVPRRLSTALARKARAAFSKRRALDRIEALYREVTRA